MIGRGRDRRHHPAWPRSWTVPPALGALAVIVASACGGSGSTPSAAGTTTVTVAATTTSSTTPPTTAATTTTTLYQPTDPQPSGQGAAETLVDAWYDASPAKAAAVATPAAVSALLSQTYPHGDLQFRGCGQQDPLECTYRNILSGSIYEIAVVPTASGGWYVEAVVVES